MSRAAHQDQRQRCRPSEGDSDDHYRQDACKPSCFALSEPSQAWLNQQTIGNSSWIESLESIIELDNARVPRNTVFLSPQWTPASIGAPYFTTLQSALNYVAAQDPQPYEPWTIVIYPGVYDTPLGVIPDVPVERPQQAKLVNPVSQRFKWIQCTYKHHALPHDGPQPMCRWQDWIRMRQLKSKIREQTQLAMDRQSTSTQKPSSLVQGHNNNDDLEKLSIQPVPDVTEARQRRDQRRQARVQPQAIFQVPANVTLHAVANYTVFINDELELDNTNYPEEWTIAFENIVFLRSITSVRQVLGKPSATHLINCTFIDLFQILYLGIFVRNNTGLSGDDQWYVTECRFLENTGIDANSDGCRVLGNGNTWREGFIDVGSPLQTCELVMDFVAGNVFDCSVRGASHMIISGASSGGWITLLDQSSVRLTNCTVATLNCFNQSQLRGNGAIQNLVLGDAAHGIFSGYIQSIHSALGTTLLFNGDYTWLNGTGQVDLRRRVGQVTVLANTTQATFNFGTTYPSANYHAVATVVNSVVPADVTQVQITQKLVGSLQVTTSPVRTYDVIVDIIVEQPFVTMDL